MNEQMKLLDDSDPRKCVNPKARMANNVKLSRRTRAILGN